MNQNILYIFIILAISFVLTILALIDIMKKDFGSTKTKVIWHFIALVPVFGWLIYFIFNLNKKTDN
jgi:heme/copper-type cytochrome/quinol oxidase subunit 4